MTTSTIGVLIPARSARDVETEKSAKNVYVNADSANLDDLDRAIVRALQVSPRGSFSLFADTLSTSEQTVARRYRRLHSTGVVRVTAVVNNEALGQTNWLVRIQCTPNGTAGLAQALAKRDDVGWVSISGGAAEVVCVVRSRTAADREGLLLDRLARTAPVLGLTTAMVLHPFLAGSADDWAGLKDALAPEQDRRLRRTGSAAASAPDDGGSAVRPPTIDRSDQAIMDAMVTDGRSTYAQLGAAAELSEGRAARRLQSLLDRGLLRMDVDLAPQALGWDVAAQLWMTTSPAHLDPVGTALAQVSGMNFVAAITGPHNVIASVICRDHRHLYQLITREIGAIAGIRSLEVSPRMRTVKQAGAMVEHARLTT